MRTADLFSGLGGFSEGARQAGASVLFAANHWPVSCDWHERNHGLRPECQDLQQFDFSQVPDIDLLLASPACQGHSTGGQPARRGTGGNGRVDGVKLAQKHQADRATAWAVVAAAEMKRPRTIIVENVPKFQDWVLIDAWRATFEALGYVTRSAVLNASTFGTPQDRERFVMTARLGEALDLRQGDEQARTIGSCIDAPEVHKWRTIESRPTRTANLIAKAQSDVGLVGMVNNVGDGVRGRSFDDVFPTVTTQSGTQFILFNGAHCRIISPRELGRAQGFADTYQLPTVRKVASKLLGNAIPVDLARGLVQQAAA